MGELQLQISMIVTYNSRSRLCLARDAMFKVIVGRVFRA